MQPLSNGARVLHEMQHPLDPSKARAFGSTVLQFLSTLGSDILVVEETLPLPLLGMARSLPGLRIGGVLSGFLLSPAPEGVLVTYVLQVGARWVCGRGKKG